MSWKGSVQNGWFDLWDGANTPSQMNSQNTNTTITRLDQGEVPTTSPIRTAILNQGSLVATGPFTKGQRSLRATIVAAAAADAFRLWSPGAIVAALTGATTNPLPLHSMKPNYFSFWVRSNTLNNVRVRLVFRTAANAIVGSVGAPAIRGEDGLTVDSGTPETIDIRMSPFWRKVGIRFIPPEFFGTDAVDHMVWQISNGTAGAQVIDIAGIESDALLNEQVG